MQREIKYKFWCPEYDEMVDVDGIFFQSCKDIETVEKDSIKIFTRGGIEWELKGDERNRLVQYTGLKDRNDKEIYEGDIVKFREFNYEDRKDRGNAVVMFGNTVDDFGYTVGYHLYLSDCIQKSPKPGGFHRGMTNHILEIIGNIFSTPELLK